jgi:hypothetical protein
MRSTPLLLIVCAACSSTPNQDAGCPDASFSYPPFSVCNLVAQSTDIVYARFNGSMATAACYRSEATLAVSSSLKGSRDGGTLSVLIDDKAYYGPFQASMAQDGLFFLSSFGSGQAPLGVSPNGGYFWQSQGRWQNAGKYVDAGLTTAELEALIADTDSGCPFP